MLIPITDLSILKELYITGHGEVKIIKGGTLAYLTPAQYYNLLDAEENNQGKEIANISAETSEIRAKILPAIPTSSKMISVTSRCKKIGRDTRENK